MMTSFAALRHFLAKAGLTGALLAGLPVVTSAHNLPAAPPATAHEKAIATVIVSSRMMPMGRALIAADAPSEYSRQLLAHFTRAHPDQETATAYARTIADSVTSEDSAIALRVARLPQMAAMMKAIEADQVHSAAYQRNSAQLVKLVSDAQLQTYWRIVDLAKGLGTFNRTLADAHEEALMTHFIALMRAFASASQREGAKATDMPRARTGLQQLDQVLDLMVGMHQRFDALEARYDAAYAKLQLDTVLEPGQLVTRAGIERGRAKLAQAIRMAQVQLAQYGEIHAAEIARLRTALAALPGHASEEIDAEFNVGTSAVMEHIRMANESLPQAQALSRRMLDFAEARIGQTRVVKGQLRFANAADNAAWLALEKEGEAGQ